MATAEEYAKMSDSEKKKEDWMNAKWRPMMGWIYMGTCFFDFVLFPVLWSLLQAALKQPVTQWQPLTLQGAGLYHIAMGAVLGLAAWGRTQEKLNGANNGGLSTPGSMPSTFGAPTSGGFGASSSFGSSAPSSFGGNSFGGSPSSIGAQPRQTGNFNAPAAAMGGAAVGAAAGFAMTPDTTSPMIAKPMPSRPPMDENFPEID